MSDAPSPDPSPAGPGGRTADAAARKRERRLWITLGEVVAVLALVIAGLNYWESRREHAADARRATVQARAEAAFVMTGQADRDGQRVVFQPLNPAQAIQSQRYLFPAAVLDHPMEVAAARPQIDLGWFAGRLRRDLDRAHAPADGEAELPVGVVTTFVQDGETQVDHSIYDLGFAYRRRFLMGRRIDLQGVSLVRRGVPGAGMQSALNARWASLIRGLGTAPAGADGASGR